MLKYSKKKPQPYYGDLLCYSVYLFGLHVLNHPLCVFDIVCDHALGCLATNLN